MVTDRMMARMHTNAAKYNKQIKRRGRRNVLCMVLIKASLKKPILHSYRCINNNTLSANTCCISSGTTHVVSDLSHTCLFWKLFEGNFKHFLHMLRQNSRKRCCTCDNTFLCYFFKSFQRVQKHRKSNKFGGNLHIN